MLFEIHTRISHQGPIPVINLIIIMYKNDVYVDIGKSVGLLVKVELLY